MTRMTFVIVVIAAPSLLMLGCVRPENEQSFSYTVDSLGASQPTLRGLDERPSRPLGVVVGPSGRRTELVTDEVLIRPEGRDKLNAFLQQYEGTILRDGTPLVIPGRVRAEAAPAVNGGYLVRVDLTPSRLDDLRRNGEDPGQGDRISRMETSRVQASSGTRSSMVSLARELPCRRSSPNPNSMRT